MVESKNTTTLSPNRQRLFAVVSLVLGTAVAVMLAEWSLDIYFQRVQVQSMDPGLIRYNSQLGWALSPGWSGQHTHYDYQSTYNIDSAGFRMQVEGGGGAQYAVLGDSFTFGLGVEDEQTFVSLLNSSGAGSFRNLGTPGTSTDQQLLLLRRVLPDDALEGVLLVVYLPNDLLDNTLPYPMQAEQAKPYFRLNNGSLELQNTPVPLAPKPALLRSTSLTTLVLNGFEVEQSAFGGTSIGRLVSTVAFDRQYEMNELRPVLERNLAPALELFAAILDDFIEETRQAELSLTVALLPGRDAMINPTGISHHYQEYLRQSLRSMLEANSVRSIDLMARMATESEGNIDQWFYPNDGHLTAAGHRYVADILAEELD